MFRLLMTVCFLVLFSTAQAAEVNLYSARKEALIKPLLDQFSQQTGIEVNLVTGSADALLKRLESEGINSPADLFLTVDVGRLHRASEAGLFQKVNSEKLNAAVPEIYREASGEWFGLSLRSRVIVYSSQRVKASQLSSYLQLADPVWKRKLCVRSSDNIYNQSLVAAMINHYGEAKTETWAKGLVANFARPPKGGDRDQIKAIASGQCDVTLVNTYYLGAMINSNDEADKKAAAKVSLFWPDQAGAGAHINISGAGVLKSAPHRDNAIQLLEFLTTDSAQQWYASENVEYPLRADIAVSATLDGWGKFKADQQSLENLGKNNAAAVRLMDRAGWK